MPLYEYQCDSCGHRFELIQTYSEAPAETCPNCGGPVKKLLSSPAIQFKGSGWYITDYARKGSSGGDTGRKEDKAAPATGDTKPAADTKTAETKAAPAKESGGPSSSSSS